MLNHPSFYHPFVSGIVVQIIIHFLKGLRQSSLSCFCVVENMCL